jgi:hypothetical protein
MKTPLLVSFLAFVLTTTPNTPIRPRWDFINLGWSRLIIVRIPPGKFWMGTKQVFTAGGNWTNDAERPVH